MGIMEIGGGRGQTGSTRWELPTAVKLKDFHKDNLKTLRKLSSSSSSGRNRDVGSNGPMKAHLGRDVVEAANRRKKYDHVQARVFSSASSNSSERNADRGRRSYLKGHVNTGPFLPSSRRRHPDPDFDGSRYTKRSTSSREIDRCKDHNDLDDDLDDEMSIPALVVATAASNQPISIDERKDRIRNIIREIYSSVPLGKDGSEVGPTIKRFTSSCNSSAAPTVNRPSCCGRLDTGLSRSSAASGAISRFASSPKLAQPVVMTAKNGTNFTSNNHQRGIAPPLSSSTSMVNLHRRSNINNNKENKKVKTLPKQQRARRQLPEASNQPTPRPPSLGTTPSPALVANDSKARDASHPASMARDFLSPELDEDVPEMAMVNLHHQSNNKENKKVKTLPKQQRAQHQLPEASNQPTPHSLSRRRSPSPTNSKACDASRPASMARDSLSPELEEDIAEQRVAANVIKGTDVDYVLANHDLASEAGRHRRQASMERKESSTSWSINPKAEVPTDYAVGGVPKYLLERREKWRAEAETKERLRKESEGCPEGHVLLTESQRLQGLRKLKTSYANVCAELARLPMTSDTLRARQKRSAFEKDLTGLERGIRTYEKSKVYISKEEL